MKQKYIMGIIVLVGMILISGCAKQITTEEEPGPIEDDCLTACPDGTSVPCGEECPEIKGPVVVKQAGGAAAILPECGDRNYLTKNADFIVAGTIQNVDTKWNDEKTKIFTHSDLIIKDYIKGPKIENDKLEVVTAGGCVEDICESVEEQPILKEGENVQIYFKGTEGEFSIICGSDGVEEIEKEIIT